MKIFITGGSGFIGGRLTERLIVENHDVTLLLRNLSSTLWVDSARVKIIPGDIFNTDSLIAGMKECDWVFHLAAHTGSWSEDPSLPYHVNVSGTLNVLEAALKSNIRKVVFTSTCGTLGYSENGETLDESSNNTTRFCTIYEETKAEAEKKAVEYCRKGLDVVIVNPSRIYGPGILTRGNSMTRIIKGYIRGTWRIVPGTGKSIGNYVFIDDVVEGHIMAAYKGVAGERYILGGENLSFSELFEIIADESGTIRKLVHLPLTVMKFLAGTMLFISKVFRLPPLITKEWLEKYMNDTIISSEKAIEQLGYRITPFRSGVKKTICWLKTLEK